MTRDEFNKLINNPTKVGKENLANLGELVNTYPYAATFRLLYVKGLHNIDDLKYESELRQTAIHTASRRHLHDLINQKPQKEQKATNDKTAYTYDLEKEYAQSNDKKEDVPKMKYGNLIDDFLSGKTEATQLATRTTTPQPENKSENEPIRVKKSPKPIQEEGTQKKPSTGVCTETLAKIYIKQQKFEKAIDIFERLCLKYPEKSSYFADQIRFLEKLIKNI